MTATQVFYCFLKRELTLDGYIFFIRLLKGENVGKIRNLKIRRSYYPKGSRTFVEDYIKVGEGRTLSGFMNNLLRHIEPALVLYKHYNQDYKQRVVFKNPWSKYTNEMVYIDTYCTLWRKFVSDKIENGDKRVYNGKMLDYKLKEGVIL